MTTDRSGQEGPSAEQIAASDREGARPSPSTPISSDAAANAAAQFLLDAAQQERDQQETGHRLPPRPTNPEHTPFFVDLPQGDGIALPLVTAAGPGPSGGGASRYDSDFGRSIAGLQANGGDSLENGTSIPDSSFAAALADDDENPTLFARAAVSGDASAGPGGGDGDKTGPSGGADDDGDLPDLFTVTADAVDFNGVTAGSYRDGSQYDASNQNDVVLLPSDVAKAAAGGMTPGTLFLAGNGDDTVTGGGLADLIDGGNGQDLLIGGTGDDTLSGGTGKDIFRFSLSADQGDDLILDFKTGKGGDTLQFADLVDATGDGNIDIADLDAVGSVGGSADAIVITFGNGASITLAGLDGSGINSFADLVDDAKVTVEIL